MNKFYKYTLCKRCENMKKVSSGLRKAIILIIILVNIATVSFAAWWGTPGYEWCFSKGITSMMTQREMNQNVELEDFYAILLRYLKYKDVDKGRNVIQTVGSINRINSALIGMMNDVNDYLVMKSLTPNQYRQVITYIEHAERLVESQQKLLNRSEIKSFYLYLSLARYKAAMLINDISYRLDQMAVQGNVKYSEILEYGIEPYYGNVTRKEFLILMFSLLSDQRLTEQEILTQYNEAGVLVGYNNDLMLEKELTYSEMFTFLYRFEIFEFNPTEEEVEE